MDLNKKLEELKPYQLNCNVFDVYSYNGLTMQDLLCQFFTKINECITVSNKTIDLAEWLVNEGLEIEVVKKLMLWLEDGTLENIINVNLFNSLNNKINDLNTQFNIVDSKISGFINAKNFGVVGDGVTDDTINLQKAIDYCNSNKIKLYINKGEYKITSPLTIYHSTEIEGNGMFNTVICVYHHGNAIEFKNGYVENCEGVTNWGDPFQGKLSNFGISNKVLLPKDSFDRYLGFNEGNAIHLEGARYMSKLTNIRVNGGYKTGFYLFGSYGTSIEGCEVNGVGNGIILDRACNGVKIDKLYCKKAGFVTTPSNFSAIKAISSTNINIVSPIIENGLGSSGIKLENCINVTIQNGYFERQTTNDRTIMIYNSHSVDVNNCNFENTLGCQFNNSYNLTFKNLTFFGNKNIVTSNLLAIRSTGDENTSYNINVVDCYYSIERNTTNVNAIPTLGEKVKLLPNEHTAIKWRDVDLYEINNTVNMKQNLFHDGMFKEGTTGTLYSDTKGEIVGNVLELTLKNEGYSFTTFDKINYTYNSNHGNNLYLIVKAETVGDVAKSISIRPDSGTSKTLELPSTTNGEIRYFITRISPVEGTTYNIRIGKLDTTTSSILNKIKIHEIYFGFYGLKYLV